jgi:hypothetical protein
VKYLDVPSFLIDCRDRVPIRRQPGAGEIQNAGASVFVCKDLPGRPDRKLQSVQPAGNGFLFRPIDLINAGETLIFMIFFGQRDKSVGCGSFKS